MDARTWLRLTVFAVGTLFSFSFLHVAQAATHRSANFVVKAPTPALAAEIGRESERLRRELAIEWLGKEMPAWTSPCPITAQVSPSLGAGGATSFVFDRGEVFGWEMNIQGSRERVLDSVLPHEITHTIFACHFRQPLPRWADEGACTTVEHDSEVKKQERMLIRFLKTGKGIPFSRMFAMKDYPPDVMPLYSQGHSLATFLIERRGKKAYLEFIADGLRDENWPAAVQRHYGHENLYVLQNTWLDWVKQGRPRLMPENPATEAPATAVAGNASPVRPADFSGDQVASLPPDASVAPIPSSDSVYASQSEARPSTGSIYDSSRGRRTMLR